MGTSGERHGESAALDDQQRADRARTEARLRILSGVGRAGVGLDPRSATKQVLWAAMRACDADSSSLGVWEPERQVLRAVLNLGDLAAWEEEEPLDETYPADQSTWVVAMADQQLGVALSLDDPDLAEDDREYLISLNKHSSISVPLLRGGTWWGELFVARNPGRDQFTNDDVEWVTNVAAHVSVALENVEHTSHIERLAQTDELTGLARRRTLERWLDQAMVDWRLHEVPIGLAMIDLNGLKRVNDDQGHDAGDRVLRQLAEILQRAAGSFSDSIVARIGGDEFCLAARGADAEQLIPVAEDLCSEGWALLPHGMACGVVLTTDAVGAVEFPGRLLRLADSAQYRAKQSRSRIPVVAGRPLPAELAVRLSGDDDGLVADRRLFRGREENSLGHLTDATLRALDQAPDEPPRARLGLVADILTQHVDGLGWWLSLQTRGSGAARTVDFSLYRRPETIDPDEFKEELTGEFAVDTYPETAAALAGRSFTIRIDDPAADPAEIAILDGLTATAVVAAGGVDEHADRWLVEVFLDQLSEAGQELAGVLRLLVLAALHPPALHPPAPHPPAPG
jgi:diguanylate cyclase (GGDEF)-like protein